jgi:hypothetical protein
LTLPLKESGDAFLDGKQERPTDLGLPAHARATAGAEASVG